MKTKITYKFLPFVLLMLVMGCSKKEDVVAPDLAVSAVGTYRISALTSSGKTVTITPSSSNIIVITRISTNNVDIVINTTTSTAPVPGVTLTGTTMAISFQKTYTDGNISGTIDNSTVTLSAITNSGATATYIASK